jgi:hypothetical protein
MAKVGKTNAGTVVAGVPSLKSRGLKNPMPADYELDPNHPDMAMDNDKAGKKKSPPASGKRTPGAMPGSEEL